VKQKNREFCRNTCDKNCLILAFGQVESNLLRRLNMNESVEIRLQHARRFCQYSPLVLYLSDVFCHHKTHFVIVKTEQWRLKALANGDTLLWTHCCRHKCFPVCGHKSCVPDTKNVSDFVQKHFVSAANVSQFAQPKKHHEQQCVRNNVSSFARAFTMGHHSRFNEKSVKGSVIFLT